MNFRRLLSSGLLTLVLMGFSSVVSAGVMEDIQATYPKIKIYSNTYQDAVGAEYTQKSMYIFETDNAKVGKVNFGIRLVQVRDQKYVCVEFDLVRKSWLFMDKATVGNGKELIYLMPRREPERELYAGFVKESFMSVVDTYELGFMKDTKIIRVSGNEYYMDVEYKKHKKKRMPYFEAIDYAIKFLNEK